MTVPGMLVLTSDRQETVTLDASNTVTQALRASSGFVGKIAFEIDNASTLTLIPEGRIPGGTWTAIQVTNLNSGAAAASLSADGVYRVDVGGLEFRLRRTAGSCTVRMSTVVG